MKLPFIAFTTICLFISGLAQAENLDDNRVNGFYLGFNHSAFNMERWHIKNANARVELGIVGFQPFDWLAIEHQQSFHTSADTGARFGVIVDAEDVSGNYLKLRFPMRSFSLYAVAGNTNAHVSATIPHYSQSPGIIEELFAIYRPSGKLPDELRHTPAGTYHYTVNARTWGFGVDYELGTKDSPGSNKYHICFEYLAMPKQEDWHFGIYSLGIHRYF